MKKISLFAMAMILGRSMLALASPEASFDETQAPVAVINLEIENTSGLTDNQLLVEIMAELKKQPANVSDKEIHVCVSEACDTIDLSDFMIPQVETIGIKETVQPSQFAKDVGQVVGQAIGGVHGSASVKVKYSETTKKGSDGSTETSKNVEVSVTVSGGKK